VYIVLDIEDMCWVL